MKVKLTKEENTKEAMSRAEEIQGVFEELYKSLLEKISEFEEEYPKCKSLDEEIPCFLEDLQRIVEDSKTSTIESMITAKEAESATQMDFAEILQEIVDTTPDVKLRQTLEELVTRMRLAPNNTVLGKADFVAAIYTVLQVP